MVNEQNHSTQPRTEQLDPAPVAVKRPFWSRLPLLAAVAGLCLLFFMLTSPKAMPSLLLIIGFIVLWLLLFALWRIALVLTGLDIRLPANVRRGIVLAGTLLPVLLLVMQSIGQLTVRDVLTMSGLFIIGVFYIARMYRR